MTNINTDNSNIFFVPAADRDALAQVLQSNQMRDKVREQQPDSFNNITY